MMGFLVIHTRVRPPSAVRDPSHGRKDVGFLAQHVLNIIYNHADFPFDSITSLS